MSRQEWQRHKKQKREKLEQAARLVCVMYILYEFIMSACILKYAFTCPYLLT